MVAELGDVLDKVLIDFGKLFQRVLNGVKQGGVLSPVLFCVYIDGLLATLKDAGIGSHIGSEFVGVLAYADDIVLLAPTPDALRLMLKLCDHYANNFNILFNASKLKRLIVRPRGMTCVNTSYFANIEFFIGDRIIEIVDEWPHIGHIISSRCDDSEKLYDRAD